MIKMIDIKKIHPHYQNPRSNLGDLLELAESIKKNGVLQNLTVVPWFSSITGVGADDPKQQEKMGYVVVIGHRRLAAAKLAGLKEVPCVISDMDRKTQLGTMLLENMQRNDLTVYEQAQGFQMMMDLGETVSNISETTGFSETTVRRRVNLLKLDKEKFKAAADRGASIMDYADLEKIENIKLRNSVLEKIGTPNFRYELKSAIEKEANARLMEPMIEQLGKFAIKTDNGNGLQYIASYYPSSNPIIERPVDVDKEIYYFVVSNYGYVTLYKKRSESDTNAVKEKLLEERKRQEECRAALEEISKRAYRLRYDFIREFSNTKAIKHIDILIEYSIRAMLEDYASVDFDDFAEFLGRNVEGEEVLTFEDISEHVLAQPALHLLIAIYLTFDSKIQSYYGWRNQYEENETLNQCYDLLEKLGYQMSDEELAMKNGTHELFMEVV
jgi:ParB family chromosome partitioning protein